MLHWYGSPAARCLLTHSRHTRAASSRFHCPTVNAFLFLLSLQSQQSRSSVYFARKASQFTASPRKTCKSNPRPIPMPFWNGPAGKGRSSSNLSRPVTRVTATYIMLPPTSLVGAAGVYSLLCINKISKIRSFLLGETTS